MIKTLIFIVLLLSLPCFCYAEKLSLKEDFNYTLYRLDNKEVIEYFESTDIYHILKKSEKRINSLTSIKQEFQDNSFFKPKFIEVKGNWVEFDIVEFGVYLQYHVLNIKCCYNSQNKALLLFSYNF